MGRESRERRRCAGKRSNCRVFAQRPSPIVPRSGSLREPMRGHCGATAHRRSDRVHGAEVEDAEQFDVQLSLAAGDHLLPGRVGAVEPVEAEFATELLCGSSCCRCRRAIRRRTPHGESSRTQLLSMS